jgi:tellurite methyltransferase
MTRIGLTFAQIIPHLTQSNPIHEAIGDTDIYLIDQIMKGRYQAKETILDAGCGHGRNLHWFLQNDCSIYGVDQDESAIGHVRSKLASPLGKLSPQPSKLTPPLSERFQAAELDALPFNDKYFDHIICSAVLHFAKDIAHFHRMVAEIVRVLKPNGSLFIRMTSDIGIEDKVHPLAGGVYQIPDGSTRFLLTRPLLAETMQKNKLSFLEPFKTVNVNDLRCMSTLVLTIG